MADLRLYSMEGPVWLPSNAPARALYPPVSGRRARVLFLGGSAVGVMGDPVQAQAAGLLCRAVPLFLAESAYVLLGLDAATLLPWSAGRGFAMLPQPWSDGNASAAAESGGAALSVVVHVTAKPEAALAQVRLVRPKAAEGVPVLQAEWSTDVSWERPDGALPGLWSRLAGHLVAPLGDAPDAPDPLLYTLPRATGFSLYIRALEQVGALRCMGSDSGNAGLLSGQYFGTRQLLGLARAYPKSLPTRLLLHEALLRLRDMDGEYMDGLRAEVLELGKSAAFADPAVQSVLERQLGLIFRA